MELLNTNYAYLYIFVIYFVAYGNVFLNSCLLQHIQCLLHSLVIYTSTFIDIENAKLAQIQMGYILKYDQL